MIYYCCKCGREVPASLAEKYFNKVNYGDVQCEGCYEKGGKLNKGKEEA